MGTDLQAVKLLIRTALAISLMASASRNGHGSIDRLPPHSLEAEKGVLGACLLAPREILDLCQERNGSGEWFYDLRHQTIFDAMMALQAEGVAVDLVTLFQRLHDQGTLEQCGGAVYLACLPDACASAANWTYYADIVFEKWLMRKMIHVCVQSVSKAYEHQGEVEGLLDNFERDALAVRKGGSYEKSATAKDLVLKTIERIEWAHQHQGELSGLPTGFVDLDKMTGGLQAGDMVVIAGLPGFGKTSLAMGFAEHAAVDLGIPVGVFSFEMSPERLMMRMVCSRARVDASRLKRGELIDSDGPKLTGVAGKIAKAPLHIEPARGWTASQVRAKARRLAQQQGCKLFVVDYLQLVAPGGGRKSDTREQEVSAVSKAMKDMAGETGCPVVVLSQLNDDGLLRESRATGQDADLVGKLEVDKGGRIEDASVPMWLKVEKQRDGEIGSVPLTFLRVFTRYESAAKIQ